MKHMHRPSHRLESGVSMVEVLVALIILMVGLLGLAGLMVQGQRSELESYQRVQALTLLQDMYGRINANRNVAQCYAFTTTSDTTPYLGSTGTGILSLPRSCTLGTLAQQTQFNNDLTAWNQLLQGAGETSSGNNVGAMIGARGCISYDSATELPELSPSTGLPTGSVLTGTGVYTLSVAWQGLGDTFAPVGLNCAKNAYGAETLRRVVSLTFRMAALDK